MIFAVINHKGGVLKTETTKWLGYHYAGISGALPLLIDLDAQANLSGRVGVTADRNQRQNIGDLLMSRASLTKASAIGFVEDRRVDIVPASSDLADTAAAMQAKSPNHTFLKRALRQSQHPITLVDCAPVVNVLTINALTAADAVIIPIKPEPDAVKGAKEVLDLLSDLSGAGINTPTVAGLVITAAEQTNPHKTQIAAIHGLAQNNLLTVLGSIPKRTGVDQAARNREAYRPIAETLFGAVVEVIREAR